MQQQKRSESGGLILSCGDMITATLPNSRLKVTVSGKRYYNTGAGSKDWSGVIPDNLTEEENAKEKVLKELIKD